MTTIDRMRLLRDKCAELGQAEVARRIGYSPSAVNQVLKGKYGENNCRADVLLHKVEDVLGSSTVVCPVLGEIPACKCSENRKREFAATNPMRIRLYRACRECKHNAIKPKKEV